MTVSSRDDPPGAAHSQIVWYRGFGILGHHLEEDSLPGKSYVRRTQRSSSPWLATVSPSCAYYPLLRKTNEPQVMGGFTPSPEEQGVERRAVVKFPASRTDFAQ